MPVIITQGAADIAVRVANTRTWIATMGELKMDFKYVELGREDHGSIIAKGMPDIFAFFKDHSRPAGH